MPSTTRAGYTFTGWYSSSGWLKVPGGGASNAHVTSYAGWAENLSITYNDGGGTITSGGSTSTYVGGTISTLPTVSKTGYTFNGWYTASSGGTRITTSSPHGRTSNFWLYAQWTPNTLNINYYKNFGTTPSGGSSTTTTGGTISSLPTTSRTGYTFNGWYLGGTQITAGAAHGQTGDFTLVASWTAKTLDITYSAGGGTTPSGGDSTTTTGGTISSLPTTSMTGYTFNGWYTAPSGGTQITTLSETHGQTHDFTLYAQWTASDLNINWDPNGGTITVAGSTTAKTAGQIATLPTVTRTGYTLDHWIAYPSGLTVNEGLRYHGNNSDFTITAQWSANTLSITYNANGGTTPSGGASTTTYGGTVSSLPTVSKTGYTFNGWYTASSGGTRITTSSPHGRTSNFTLYAQWSINWYTFSFDSNGGNNTPVGSTRYYGQSISGTCFITSRTGYSLTGWKSSFDNVTYGSSCSSGTGRTLTGFTMPASNVVFTAQWTADTLTITYDSQGGSPIADGDSATTTGGSISTLPTDPTRSGYTFAGWYTASSGGTQITANAAHGQTADFTLHAQWSLIPVYTLTYDANGGSGSPPSGATAANGVGVTVASHSALSRPGYTFAAWNTAASGTGTGHSSGDTLTMGAANVTLYAQWTADTLTITYDSQGGSVVTDGDTTTLTTGAISPLPTPPTRSGYTFAGWNSASDGTGIDFGVWIAPGQEVAHGQTAHFTLYAQWTADTLTITYDSQGGSPIADGDSATTTGGSISTLPTDPTRSGYTFNGWFTATSGGSQITTSNPHGQISDFTLFAQWTQIPVQVAPTAPTGNTLTITYDENGGDATPSGGDNTTTYGGTISTLPTDPTRSGYTFAGWYTASSGGTQITTSSPHGQTADFTLHAQWSLIPVYTLTYDANGGSGSPPSGATAANGVGVTVASHSALSRPGYTFAAWNTAALGTGTGHSSGDTLTMGAANVTLYAQWTADTLTISYDSQGGSPIADGDSATTTGGSVSTLPTDPTRSGYTFAGWNSASDGTGIDFGVWIAPGQEVAHGQTADFTLHAQWSLIPVYTLTYDANGGSGSPPSGATAANGVGVTVASHSALSRPGYTFAAWNTAASGTGTGHSSGDTLTMGAANVTLYAQWTADTLTISYDSQGGSVIADGDSATTTGGSVSTLPTDPTRSGYTFNGWFTATSGGSQITTSNPHGQISDFTLFAQWTQIPVQVAPTALPVIAPAAPPSSFTIDMGDGSWCLVEHSNERIATDMSVPVGARFSVHGTQFQPDSDIEIWLNSTRVLFGTATAGIDNSFVLTSNLPDQLEPGEHTLEIVGINLAGDLQTTRIGLLVDDLERVETPDLELPITGRNDAVVLNWSLALLVAGILVGALSRRRGLLQGADDARIDQEVGDQRA